jgi:dihydrofolate synthase/folylpolyglutamate synthase
VTAPLDCQASEQEAWTLQNWLDYLLSIHPKDIEFGLERVDQVKAKLGLSFTQQTVITVAGTNGKGTTCALIEQAALQAGRSVGVYSSPHITDYEERVRVNGKVLDSRAHCVAFQKIECARKDTLLTYFEFGTLAALQLLAEQELDIVILEIGLGGRLDAVNCIDPDIAVITTIDLDHQDWLGDTREKIAIEKAGIFRKGIPAVIGEPNPPESLKQAAKQCNLVSYWQGQDFTYSQIDNKYHWQSGERTYQDLPVPNIPQQNAATALKVIELLELTLSLQDMIKVFSQIQLPGRRQIVGTAPLVMLDVAHNPQATELLNRDLAQLKVNKLFAVVAMLADKDIIASLEPLFGTIDTWYCASLDVPRGAQSSAVATALTGQPNVHEFISVQDAIRQALSIATPEDGIIVLGSFFTVAEALSLVKQNPSLIGSV